MKKWVKILLITLVIILVLVNFISWSGTYSSVFCTQMACSCTKDLTLIEVIDGEKECNSCSRDQWIFTTVLFNGVRSCSGKEILVCSEGKIIDERIDWRECNYGIITVLDFIPEKRESVPIVEVPELTP